MTELCSTVVMSSGLGSQMPVFKFPPCLPKELVGLSEVLNPSVLQFVHV